MSFTDKDVEAAIAHLKRRAEKLLAGRDERRARVLSRIGEIARRLHEEFGVTRVFSFGSLETPWFTEESDVDLAVEGLDPAHVYSAEKLVHSLLGEPFDLLRMEELPESFRRVIEEEGRLVE